MRLFSYDFVGLPDFPQGKRCWLLAVFGGNLQLTSLEHAQRQLRYQIKRFLWRLKCLLRFWRIGLRPCGIYSVNSVYGALGWVPCGVYCVSSVYEAFGLFFFKIFICICNVFCSVAWRGVAWRSVACSVYGALGWDPCGVHNVCSDYKAFGLVVFCGI